MKSNKKKSVLFPIVFNFIKMQSHLTLILVLVLIDKENLTFILINHTIMIVLNNRSYLIIF